MCFCYLPTFKSSHGIQVILGRNYDVFALYCQLNFSGTFYKFIRFAMHNFLNVALKLDYACLTLFVEDKLRTVLYIAPDLFVLSR